jgi:hypothetical protein
MERSLAMARELDDPRSLAYALRARLRVWFDPTMLDERLETARELVALGRRTGDLDTETWGQRWYVNGLWELGDFASLDRELARLHDLVVALGQPLQTWAWTLRAAGRALVAGDVEAAERLADEAVAMCSALGSPFSIGASRYVREFVQFHRGQSSEPRDAAPRFGPVERLLFHLAEGDHKAVRATLGELEPFDDSWHLPAGAQLGTLAEAAWMLRDADLAADVLRRLSPIVDHYVVIGPGLVAMFPVHHAAGVAAAAIGRLDDAVAHLEAALDQERSAELVTLELLTGAALGEVLIERGDDRASPLLADVAERARVLGLGMIERRARRAVAS